MDIGASTGGPGRIQAVIDTGAGRVDAAYQEFLGHAQSCPGSCRIGVNCVTAIGLQHAWRDSKNEALS